MTAIVLPSMSPAQESGWEILLSLAEVFPDHWCLVGGQMVWLLAAEHDVEPPRATDDVDIVIDIRADPTRMRRICSWLENQGLPLAGISDQGIGHRYQRACEEGPGTVIFDVLAPDGIGQRADLTTTPPARTLSAPGTTAVLNSAELVEVLLRNRVGHVRRPSLLASVIAKASATTIAVRVNQERDWTDAAFPLSLIPDPITAARGLASHDRRRIRRLAPLLDETHLAWRPLSRERRQLGRTALEFMLDT